MVGEELRRVLRRQVQHVADRQARVAHLERRRLEARAPAGLARRDDVRQERHLRHDGPLPVARRAAPAGAAAVEGEARRRVAPRLGVGQRGEELPHLVPDAEERRRHAARGATDGRLIDRERALHGLVALDRLRTRPAAARRASARDAAPGRTRWRTSVDLPEPLTPGDDAHAADRHAERHVVAGCSRARHAARSTRRPSGASAVRRERSPSARARSAIAGRPGRAPRGPRTTTCPPWRPPLGPRSMTWSAARMVSASCSTTSTVEPMSASERRFAQEALRVARVQADRGLVEHVERARQPAAELRAEAEALHLAARERGRGASRARGSRGPPARRTRGGARAPREVPWQSRRPTPGTAMHERERAPSGPSAAVASAYVSPWSRTPRGTALSREPSHAAHASCRPSSLEGLGPALDARAFARRRSGPAWC